MCGVPHPVWVRRLLTVLPAVVVVWLGVNATDALVLSQVVLSVAVPIPVIALIVFTRRRDIMSEFASSLLTDIAGIAAAVVILTLNAVLVHFQADCAA
jgi:manganese transport protein